MSKENKKDYAYVNKQKDGNFRVRIQVNGKRSIKYFNTKEEAESYREEIKSQQARVYKKGTTKYISLGALFNEYLEEKSLEWTQATVYNREKEFKLLFKGIVRTWFHEVSKDMVMDIIKKEKTMHTRKVYSALFFLEQMDLYSKDKYRGYGLDWSPTILKKKVKIKKGTRKKEREYNTIEEIRDILDFIQDPKFIKLNKEIFYHVYIFGLNTGCRVGELCAAKKKNFFEDSRTLIIEDTISIDKRGLRYDSPGTKTSAYRKIRLSPMAIAAIKALSSMHDGKYIIPPSKNSDKEFLSPAVVADFFRTLCKRLDLPWIGTHGMFRKTFATQVAINSKKGFRDMVATIQKQLGHKSPQMTMHYIQAVDTDIDEELEFLSEKLKKKY